MDFIADLKERVINPTMRSFPEDAKQRIKDFAIIASTETLEGIKDTVGADTDVQRKPKKWLADALNEFDEIVSGQDKSKKISKGLKM